MAAAARVEFAAGTEEEEEEAERPILRAVTTTVTSEVSPSSGSLHLPIDRSEEERKPYIGGYRDKRNGLEYHHGFSQTPVERVSKWAGKAPRLCRETQTTVTTTRAAQTFREGGTQTLRHDLHEDTGGDLAIVSRPYFSADELANVRESKALIMQCYWRGYLARCRANYIRSKIAAQRAEEGEREAKRLADASVLYEKDIERRLHPKSIEDFAVLYDEVEAWRLSETAKIKETLSEDREQKEALALLLAKQTALLATIERLRVSASKEAAEVRLSTKFEKMAAPKMWRLADGTTASVHTPFTTRASELKALFDGLSAEGLPAEDRLNLLVHVKYTVMEFDCSLSREIVGLVDRETDMLSRKRPDSVLAGLRQRLRTLFLAFCETPSFNPEAVRFQSLPPGVAPAMVPSLLDTRTVA